jgi:hypothetical protein
MVAAASRHRTIEIVVCSGARGFHRSRGASDSPFQSIRVEAQGRRHFFILRLSSGGCGVWRQMLASALGNEASREFHWPFRPSACEN